MRTVKFEKITEAMASLCIGCCYELDEDVLSALKKAQENESNPAAVKTLGQLIENGKIAHRDRIPLCQDTGLAVVFIEQGSEVLVAPATEGPGETIIEAINAGVAIGYEKGYLRKSVVAEPLNQRENTGLNIPAIVYHNIVKGDKLSITVMAKGGGCENKSQFRMFLPTAGKEQIIDWIVKVVASAGADACPPFVIGVGIGGNFEYSCLLSKKALLRKLGSKNSDDFYAQLEGDLFKRINALGLGPGGLGGDTTALAVLVETAACHIASLPVAVNIECHSHRHKSVVL